jgi:tol-pal system protein YbgF
MKRPAIHRLAFLAMVAVAAIAPPAFAQDAAEIFLRLDRLEAENRRLNGQIEELRFANRRLEDQLRRFQQDADLRMRDLEGARGGAVRPQAATPAAPVPGTAPPGRRSDAFDPAQSPAAPGAPQSLSPGGNAPVVLPGGALPPGARPQAPAAPVAAAPAPQPGGDAKSDFDFAKGLHDRGDLELAEGAFRDFLRKYPRDRRVADATFWLGEGLYGRTRFREAAEQYLTVTTRHAQATRAPEAMLKLGMSLRGLGAKDEACGTFDQVGRKYPKAPPAILAAATRERARAQC